MINCEKMILKLNSIKELFKEINNNDKINKNVINLCFMAIENDILDIICELEREKVLISIQK